MLDGLLQWDKEALLFLNGLGSNKYDMLWLGITNAISWIPLFLSIIAIFFLKFNGKKAFAQVLTVISLAFFVTWLAYFVKTLVQRTRPCNDGTINSMMRILHTPADYSFFSGHASSSFSITALTFLFLKDKVRWSFLFFIWPLLFSYSRLYLGVHFPLDVLVGGFTGILSAWVFYKLYIRFIAPCSGSIHP